MTEMKGPAMRDAIARTVGDLFQAEKRKATEEALSKTTTKRISLVEVTMDPAIVRPYSKRTMTKSNITFDDGEQGERVEEHKWIFEWR